MSNQQPANAPIALPLYHREHHYYMASEEAEFQAMLSVWYQVADVLKAQPPGTIANLGEGEGVYIAPLGGELFLFLSAEVHVPSGIECGILRPTEFEQVYGDTFDDLREKMTNWLARPEYFEPIPPEKIAACVSEAFTKESHALWVWNGNDPKQIPNQ